MKLTNLIPILGKNMALTPEIEAKKFSIKITKMLDSNIIEHEDPVIPSCSFYKLFGCFFYY